MAPASGRALVLRVTPYGEADLIVDLLFEEQGRLAALARSARRSHRRFGGALQIGTRLQVRLAMGRGLPTLSDCDLESVLNATLTDLERISQLSYVVEIARTFSKEGEGDPQMFGLVAAYLDALEAESASDEALALWELAMLAHLGYGLRLGPCRVTGGAANALSLAAGGAVQAGAVNDAELIPPPALAVLSALTRGEQAAHLRPEDREPVRRAFARIWARIAGRPLRSAAFVLPFG